MKSLYLVFVIAGALCALGYMLFSSDNFLPYFPKEKKADGSVVAVMDGRLLDKMEVVLKKHGIPYKRGADIELRVPAALLLSDSKIEALEREAGIWTSTPSR